MSGLLGTRLNRGVCPECLRMIAGGRLNQPGPAMILLLSHNAPSSGRCPGSRREVPVTVTGAEISAREAGQ
jgi:hypothetical protein